jgi:hypothetical protein
MFLRLPSGLAIYYLVSNVFQIGQQYFTNWLIGPPPVQAPRPPAERRLKSAARVERGSGERVIESQPNPNSIPTRSVGWDLGLGFGIFAMSLTTDIADFVQTVVRAMGTSLTATIEETPEATRINLEGEDGGILVRPRREGLQALQHLVATRVSQASSATTIASSSTATGFDATRTPSCVRWPSSWPDKARSSGAPQEIGPLNPYERRIVHLPSPRIPA